MIDQSVGAFGQTDRILGDPSSRVEIIVARQQVCPKRPPGYRRLQRVAGETFTLHAQFARLRLAVENKACAAQQGGGLRGVGVQAHATKAVVGLAQV